MRESVLDADMAGNQAAAAQGGAIAGKTTSKQGNRSFRQKAKVKTSQKAAAAKCACCKGEFRKKWAWQECCSRDCQLIYLAARTFLKAYREGRADGLKPIIDELKREF